MKIKQKINLENQKEKFIWQLPFLFLIFIAPLSTSLSELTKGVFAIFFLVSFFVPQRRKIIFEKLKNFSFLLKLVLSFFIIHLVTLFISGFSTGYWGDSKIGILNHTLGVFIPHVVIFFYSIFFFRIELLKKIFIPFLIFVILVTGYSLVNIWTGKQSLSVGLYGKLTTHARFIAIFFTVVFGVFLFSIQHLKLPHLFMKNIDKKKIVIIALFLISVVLLFLEFKNSISRNLILSLLAFCFLYLLYFLKWGKTLILMPFVLVLTWLILPIKIKEKIWLNINFFEIQKNDIKVNKITFKNSSQAIVYFDKSINKKKVTVNYYDNEESFEEKYYSFGYIFDESMTEEEKKQLNYFNDNDSLIINCHNTNSFSLFVKIEHGEEIKKYMLLTYHNKKIKILENYKSIELNKGSKKGVKEIFKHLIGFGEKKKKLKIDFLQTEREILWKSAWNVIQKKIFSGFGFRSWHHFSKKIEYNEYGYIYKENIDTSHYYLHNNFLDIWYGNGLFNLLFFVFFLICFFGFFFYYFFIKKEKIENFQNQILFIFFIIFFQFNLIGLFDITLFITSPIGSLYWFVCAVILQNDLSKKNIK